MTLALDQNLGTNSSGGATATTIDLVTAATAASGSKIFLDIANFSAAVTLSSVSGGGLSWNVDLKASNGSERYARASADAPSGLASGTTLTGTFTGSTGDRSISGVSFTGVETGTGNDGTNSSTAGAGASWSSGAISTTNANDLLLGGGTEDGSGTAAASPNGGYTEINDFNNAGSSECWQSVYQIVAATSSYTAGGTFSPSGTVSVGLMVVYKAAVVASAGGGTYVPVRIPNPRVGPMAMRMQLHRGYWPQAGVTSQTFPQLLTATVTTTASMTRQVGKNLSATATTTATMVKQVGKQLTATASTTATIVKQVGKTLTATATTTASMLAQKAFLITLAATVTTTATMTRQVGKVLSATATTSATITKRVNKTVAATATTTATITKQIAKTLSAGVSSTASMVAQFIAAGGQTIYTRFFGGPSPRSSGLDGSPDANTFDDPGPRRQ